MTHKEKAPTWQASGLPKTMQAGVCAENDTRALGFDPVAAVAVFARFSADELRAVQSAYERETRSARSLPDQVDGMFRAALACSMANRAMPHAFLFYLPPMLARDARRARLGQRLSLEYVRGLVSAAHDIVRVERGAA